MKKDKAKGRMTLEEHDAWLKETGQYDAFQEANRERDRILAEKEARLNEAEKPLVAALRGTGLKIDCVWDLVGTREPYPAAVPILLEHMDRDYPPEIREGIARALAVPEAIIGWPKIKTAFLNDPNPTKEMSSSKWAWALALGNSADDSVISEVIELARDASIGHDRSPLVGALLRSKDPRAKQVLDELERDPLIGKEVKMARKKGRWPGTK